MFKTIKYLGSRAGDKFTYSVGTRFSAVFEKGKTQRVPSVYADALLQDPAFEEVAEKPKKTDKETE